MRRRQTTRSQRRRQPASGTDDRPQVPVKERALRLLGVRSRSREELRRRLLLAGYHPSEIESALDDLEGVGLVDDERFATDLASYEMGRRGKGRRGAVATLRRHGIGADLAVRTVEQTAPEDEDERAAEIARRRLARLGTVEPAVAQRRLLGFLLRRGYDLDTARTACRRAFEGGEPA